MLAMKAIKPTRMNDDALRLTLLNAMRSVGKDIKADFQKTTKTWDHKVEFELLISLTGPGPVVMVGTDDKIYGYVDKGTKPHIIMAGVYTGKSDKKTLAFPSQFTPKTTPKVIGSSAGSRGGDTVLRPYVQHPGTEAREFDVTIEKMWEKKFKARMEAAMKEAAQKSGQGV